MQRIRFCNNIILAPSRRVDWLECRQCEANGGLRLRTHATANRSQCAGSRMTPRVSAGVTPMMSVCLVNRLALASVLSLACPVVGRLQVGAVRWDAWYGAPPGNVGIVGRTVTVDLSPERFHYRLPFFAEIHPFNPLTNSTVCSQSSLPRINHTSCHRTTRLAC